MHHKQVFGAIVLFLIAIVLTPCASHAQSVTLERHIRDLIRTRTDAEQLAALLESPCLEAPNDQAWQTGDLIQALLPLSEVREILVDQPVPRDQVVAILLRGQLVDYRDLPLVHRRLGFHVSIVMNDSTCYSVQWDGALAHGGRLGRHWFAVP